MGISDKLLSNHIFSNVDRSSGWHHKLVNSQNYFLDGKLLTF
jgi:hypothetical protein